MNKDTAVKKKMDSNTKEQEEKGVFCYDCKCFFYSQMATV